MVKLYHNFYIVIYFTFRAASIAASLGTDLRKRMVSIWPEWSDMDINGEKWVCIELQIELIN